MNSLFIFHFLLQNKTHNWESVATENQELNTVYVQYVLYMYAYVHAAKCTLTYTVHSKGMNTVYGSNMEYVYC
jgi:hypothetical protein